MPRLVDIFAGCGGLSLGFDLCKVEPRFRTVLAVDNEPSAIRLFNSNFSRIHSEVQADIGRVADVCWFETAQEIRLFYLCHIARVEGDEALQEQLSSIGLGKMLGAIRQADSKAEAELVALSEKDHARKAFATIPKATLTLAIVRKLTSELGLKRLGRGDLDRTSLPWAEDYDAPAWKQHVAPQDAVKGEAGRKDYGKHLWTRALSTVSDGATKQGRGQAAGNNARYRSLLDFLETDAGAQLRSTVIAWRTKRRALIDAFLKKAGAKIDRLYFGEYRVEGLLGGPPCKGFSRIGRPVANALRDQGTFAWSSGEFGDERNKLVLHYVMFLEALQPRFFLFENVSNFQSALKTPDGTLQADELLAEAVENLSAGKLHYDIASTQLKASKFGVPQSRIRFIMFGINKDLSDTKADEFFRLPVSARELGTAEAFFGLPAPREFVMGGKESAATTVECAEVVPPRTDPSLRRYFEWIQQPVGKRGKVDAHIFRQMRADDQAFFAFLGPGIRWMDLEIRRAPTLKALQDALRNKPELAKLVEGSLALRLILEETVERQKLTEQHLLSPSYLGNGSGAHGDWIERLEGDRPSKTVVAHIGKDTYGYVHPYSTRPITLREAARLQSFPDQFSFASAGLVDAYGAVGNAVPPLLALVFAERAAEILFGKSGAGDDRKVVSFTTAQRRLL